MNVYPDKEKIIVDFEAAAIQVITTKFPNAATHGCFYHLTQNTWRKIQELGFTSLYKENDEFRVFCGKIDSLAFLPVADVTAGMMSLHNTCPAEAVELLSYFDSNYVTRTYRPGRRNQQDALNLRRIPLRFPPMLWNVHVATLKAEAMTNNLCEGWNCQFYHLVGHHHPSIWRCILSLQKEEVTVSAILTRNGEPPKKKKVRVFIQMQQRLKSLVTDYNNGNKTMEQFLQGLLHNIRLMDD